jgi:CBS domain-containing protein
MVLKQMTSELYDSLGVFRNKKVRELMESPIIADVDSPISKIIGILIENNVYEVFIKMASNSIASINIRDILSVRDIVSTKPSILGKIIPSLSEEEGNIGYAARIMSHYRLRALPIVRDTNEIVGQITAKAIVKVIYETDISADRSSISTINASNIMTPNPIVIRPKNRVSTAKGIMMRRRIDHLPVIEEENNKLIGMLTSTHIAQAMLPSEKIGRWSLGIDNKSLRLDFSVIGIADHNGDNITISNVDDSLRSVIGLMVDTNSTYSVIKALEKVRGIITYRDIIALLGEERIEESIPAYIVGLPDDPFDAELAKSKFTTIIKLLGKIFPEIEEARCHIKIRDIEGERRRYEVDANIITPYRRHTYTNRGWDLATMFDQMSDSLKKKLAHRPSRRQKESMRHITDVTEGQ